MGFSQTFLQGFQVGSQRKLQQEAAARQAEQDRQRATLELEDLKLRQGSAKLAEARARMEAELHPLNIEEAITKAGLLEVPPGGGAAGPGVGSGALPPTAPLAGTAPAVPPSGEAPSAPGMFDGAGASSLQHLLQIGGRSFRRPTLEERLEELRQVEAAKATGEVLPEDLVVDLPGGKVTVPRGTPRGAAGSIISGTASSRASAADNATARANALTAADTARYTADAASARGRLKVRNVPGIGLVLDGDIQDALSRGAGDGVETGPGGVPIVPAALPAATKHVVDKGRQTLILRDKIHALLKDPDVQAGLGPIAGRVTSLKQLAGVPHPKVQQLAAELSGFMALAQGIHGFRSAEMAERLFDTYSGTKFTPEAIAAAVDGMSQVAQGWAALGEQHGYKSEASTPSQGQPGSGSRFVIKRVQ